MSSDDDEVRELYLRLLDLWNQRDARKIAALFEDEGVVVGFDGSLLTGRAPIEAELSRIFSHHQTASYVSKVRSVRSLTPEVAMLAAVAGMVPPGQSDLKPDVNAVQILVASRRDAQWRIALFQNTPARFHGRPEESERLTRELRQVLRERSL